MTEFLTGQTGKVEYDEQLVRRLIERVTGYDGKFMVEFKKVETLVNVKYILSANE